MPMIVTRVFLNLVYYYQQNFFGLNMPNSAVNAEDSSSAVDLTFIQASLDTMQQGLSIVRLIDGELTVVLFNRRAIELFDVPPELCDLPRPFADFIRLSANRGEYGPGDPEMYVRETLEHAKTFMPHSYKRTRHDGAVIEIVGTPMPDRHGFVTTYTDITEREHALSNSKILMQALNSTRVGMIIFDAETKLIFFSTQMQEFNKLAPTSLELGISFEDYIRTCVYGGLMPRLKGHEEDWIADRLKRFNAPEGPVEVKRHDDLWLMIEDVKLENGFNVIFATDITELKKSQKNLVDSMEHAEIANRTKTEFLANMSHELRTPLNSVIGFSELLLSGVGGDIGSEQAIEYLTDINLSGRHLLRLISDILDISKIEADELDLDEEPVSLRTLSDECLRMTEDRAQRAGVRVALVGELPAQQIYADPIRLKQIILNLMTNAIKFSHPDHIVGLVWLIDDQSLVLEVRDTGIGMTEASIAVVLEPFRQIANSLTRDHEGAGLGLPICRRLAELHGAQLKIESTYNVGTTVRVTFPPERTIPAGSSVNN